MKVSKKKARNDIYAHGLRTPADNKQGFVLDRSQPRGIDDKVIVKKGQEYYSWKFRNSPAQISLTYPKPQQLTRSEFMITVYDIQDRLDSLAIPEGNDASVLESEVEEICSEIETLRDETQEKLDNMPQQLQDADTGQLMQERIEALDEWKNNLESIDYDYDGPSGEDLEDSEEDEAMAGEQHFMEWAQSKIEEIQAITFNL